MSNDKNKAQLNSLLLHQWTTGKTYVIRLVDGNLSHAIDEEV